MTMGPDRGSGYRGPEGRAQGVGEAGPFPKEMGSTVNFQCRGSVMRLVFPPLLCRAALKEAVLRQGHGLAGPG